MALTNVVDLDTAVSAIQDRTDAGGSPVTDVDGEDLRLFAGVATGGVIQDSAWKAQPGSGYSLDVGSGIADADLAVVEGTGSQGNYIVRKALGTINVPLGAADLALNRIDELYLVVDDNPYDASGRGLPALAVRQGDDAASPSAPGPDGSWTAYLLLATVTVPAGAVSVAPGDIVDERVKSGSLLITDPEDIGAVPDAEFDSHVSDFDAHVANLLNPHVVTAAQVGTYDQGTIDTLLAGKANSSHVHAGTDITTGVIAEARLPNASTGAQGVVQLYNGVNSTSTALAATANAAKTAYDKGNHSHPYVALNDAGLQTMSGSLQLDFVRVAQGAVNNPGFALIESSNDTGMYGNDNLGRIAFTVDGGVSDYVMSNAGLSSLVSSRDLGASSFPWDNVFYTGSLTPISDPRLKKNIRPLATALPEGGALEVVEAVEPIAYDNKKDHPGRGLRTRKRVGFDARSMRKATGGPGSGYWSKADYAAQSVKLENGDNSIPDGVAVELGDEETVWLNLDETLAMLWQAVRELNEKVDA